MGNPAQIKKFIKCAAKDAGFVAAGICTANPLKEIIHFNKWLENDCHGTMRWLEKNPAARCDPKSFLPEAKSVICLAVEYGENGIEGGGGRKIKPANAARFARGLEYHEYVLKQLKVLWDMIKREFPQAKAKFCVDTSPILEKSLAVRAGLGWQGKNSLVIHPLKGSFFVLGEIITDLEIEPDTSLPAQCGDCNECIDACPTKAINPPGVLDARRCLSYLSIEHKGPIEPSLRRFISKKQYGCDVCQEVCPYNRR